MATYTDRNLGIAEPQPTSLPGRDAGSSSALSGSGPPHVQIREPINHQGTVELSGPPGQSGGTQVTIKIPQPSASDIIISDNPLAKMDDNFRKSSVLTT